VSSHIEFQAGDQVRLKGGVSVGTIVSAADHEFPECVLVQWTGTGEAFYYDPNALTLVLSQTATCGACEKTGQVGPDDYLCRECRNAEV
jgi:hypothetical protein